MKFFMQQRLAIRAMEYEKFEDILHTFFALPVIALTDGGHKVNILVLSNQTQRN